jgi:hypothetical protein
MEGPNGCQSKSSRFLLIGLLGIVQMGPRALHWGPTQISSHPTWRSTWRNYKTWALMRLGPYELWRQNFGPKAREMGQGFLWPQLQNLGPHEIGP